MDKERFAIIKAYQQERETDELLAIYTQHDTEEWGKDAFEAIKEILLERGVDIWNNAHERSNERISIQIKTLSPGDSSGSIRVWRLFWIRK